MIRGVSFKVPQNKTTILVDILCSTRVLEYNWYCIQGQSEAWSTTDSGEETCFLEDFNYDGECFWESIQRKHNIIFLKLEAYVGEADKIDVYTYEEFQISNCQLLLLMYDCEFVEIYAKDQKELRQLFLNAHMQNFKEIAYITEHNDGRVETNVL